MTVTREMIGAGHDVTIKQGVGIDLAREIEDALMEKNS